MGALRRFVLRVINGFRPGRAEDELARETAAHLALLEDDFRRRGLSPDDARLAARRTFGGVEQTKDRHRDARSFVWLDDARRDVLYAARTLRKTPGFTAAAVLTLALGIGANVTIFTLLDAVVFKPLPVPAAGELVTLYENGPEGIPDSSGGSGRFLHFSYPRFERLEQALGPLGSMAAVTRSSLFIVRLPGAAAAQFHYVQLASGRYFQTLGVSAARGRLWTADDVRPDRVSPVAVISDGFWKRMMGGSDAAIGQTLIVNGVNVTVVGITPPGFSGMWTDRDADLWLPIALQPALHYQNNSSSYGRYADDEPWLAEDLVAWVNLVARVAAPKQPQAIARLQAANQQGLAALVKTFRNPKNRAEMLAHTLVVEPFSRGFSGLRARFSGALFALTAMVAVVLIVTCANIANLLLARAVGRARDLAIRISLGASNGRLVRQCLAESLTLAAAGGAGGALFARWASGFLAHQVLGTSSDLPTVFSPDLRVLLFATGLSLATALVFGLVPALRAIQVGRIAAAANQRQGVSHVAAKGMQSLVVGQLALSVVVVFAAILLGRTLINFTRIETGFAGDQLVTASFDPITSGYVSEQYAPLAHRLVEAVRTAPGVRSVSASRCGLLAGCSTSSPVHLEGAEAAISPNMNWVSPGYFLTTGIPLVVGREFDERDSEHGARVAIVNESIARRYFPGQNPIGRRLGSPQLDTEIVGVARDAHTQTLHEPPVPMVYFPIDQRPAARNTAITNLDVRVAGDPRQVIADVRTAIRRSEPGLLLLDVGLMSARVARDLSRERVVAYLAFSFGLLTLFLASLGLYGVLSYGVTRRTQEIGVRMALGARRGEVMASVLRQSLRLTIAGIALGLAGAAAVSRSLSGMLFEVAPLDPMAFVAVGATFVLVMTLAAFLPARRATNVDPLVALRCE
ncbi:MAG TPA: ABC transporter permease [Vicinamibacterales bacterium]|jgi:predicted permease